MKKFTNFTKKIFIFFLIFNLTFVSSAQAAATFVDSFDVVDQGNLQGNLSDAVAFNIVKANLSFVLILCFSSISSTVSYWPEIKT